MFKNYFQGSLFAQDLLDSSIAEFPEWEAYGDQDLAAFESEVQSLFKRFPTAGNPNETQTEDDLIWPVLRLLGWTEGLRQQNLSAKGREVRPLATGRPSATCAASSTKAMPPPPLVCRLTTAAYSTKSAHRFCPISD